MMAPAIIITPPMTVGAPMITSSVQSHPITAPMTGSSSSAIETMMGGIHRKTVFTPVCPKRPGPMERYATHTSQRGSIQPRSAPSGGRDEIAEPSRMSDAAESHIPAPRVTGKA